MSVEEQPKADVAVLYFHSEEREERFTEALTYEEGLRRAKELEAEGHEVLSLITPEHAKERQSAMRLAVKEDVSMDDVHLHQFLQETVRNFRKFYPGASREAALEVTILLCGLLLDGGDPNLQGALLDEIDDGQATPGESDWRNEMKILIDNRRPDEG